MDAYDKRFLFYFIFYFWNCIFEFFRNKNKISYYDFFGFRLHQRNFNYKRFFLHVVQYLWSLKQLEQPLWNLPLKNMYLWNRGLHRRFPEDSNLFTLGFIYLPYPCDFHFLFPPLRFISHTSFCDPLLWVSLMSWIVWTLIKKKHNSDRITVTAYAPSHVKQFLFLKKLILTSEILQDLV